MVIKEVFNTISMRVIELWVKIIGRCVDNIGGVSIWVVELDIGGEAVSFVLRWDGVVGEPR